MLCILYLLGKPGITVYMIVSGNFDGRDDDEYIEKTGINNTAVGSIILKETMTYKIRGTQ